MSERRLVKFSIACTLTLLIMWTMTAIVAWSDILFWYVFQRAPNPASEALASSSSGIALAFLGVIFGIHQLADITRATINEPQNEPTTPKDT